MTSSFEEGRCKLDECVFEDTRGVRLSEIVVRKFTPRKILRSLCKQLWNTSHWGVLTNGRRRSLYENNVFERKLRERGASAAILGNVVELLATTYALMDFVHIWFVDGSDETGLRLSAETFRVATEKATMPIPPPAPHNTILRHHHATESQSDQPHDKATTNGVVHHDAILPQLATFPSIPSLPSSVPIFQIPQAPKLVPPPPTLDTALVLAKMLHDDRLRTRVYNDPTLLFDLCCSLGLDRRQDNKASAPASVPTTSNNNNININNNNHHNSTDRPSSPPAPVAPPTQPIVPIFASPNTPPPRPSVTEVPITPPISRPSNPETPKLTITLAPKSPTITGDSHTTTTTTTTSSTPVPLAPSVPSVPSPPSPPHKRAARGRRGGKHTDTVSRRYHRRRSDSPPKSPSQSDFPYNLGDPNDAVGAETSSVVKQEPSGDDVPNSMTALRRTRAASAPPPSASGTASTPSSSSSSSSVASTTLSSSAAHSTTPTPSTTPAFDNTLASLKFTVESIDLGTYEQEKITFVATLKDGKKRRLHLTKDSISKVFPSDLAKYYMDEVTKFREGSGNSSYRSVMRRRHGDS